MRTAVEPRLGFDFANVRIHADEPAAGTALSLGAAAYTIGEHIVFAPTRWAPHTAAGRSLLVHELVHTLQPVAQLGARTITRPEDAAERQADRLAARALAGEAPLRGEAFLPRTAPVACQPAAGPSAAALKETAQKTHEMHQRRVAVLIDDALALQPRTDSPSDSNALVRNSAEWIAAKRSPLTVLSLTHDASTRKPGWLAYFDKTVQYPNVGGDYPELPTASDDAQHVEYAPPNFAGTETQGEVTILFGRSYRSDDDLQKVIVHEVQHAADQTGVGTSGVFQPGRSAGTPGLTGSAMLQSSQHYTNYQSEFRAYWIESGSGSSTFGSPTAPATNVRTVSGSGSAASAPAASTHFANERQQKIFWHLADNYPDVANQYVTDAAYRTMVDAFDRASGVNLVNSTRLQAFSDVLGACSPQLGPSDAAVRDLFVAVAALDATDLAFLNDPAAATALWRFAGKRLSLPIFERLLQATRPKPPVGDFPGGPAWPAAREPALA